MRKFILIAPSTFGISVQIAEAMQQALEDWYAETVEVQFVDECPLLGRSLRNRLVQKLATERMMCHLFLRKLRNLDLTGQIGLVLIRARYMDKNAIAYILERVPADRIVQYVWDSQINLPYLADQIVAFPTVKTFDPLDAKELGIDYLPLYLPKPIKLTKFESCAADIGYFGTCYGQRLEAAAIVDHFARMRRLEFQNRLFLSRFQYFNNATKSPGQVGMMKAHSHRTPASAHKVLASSRVIFDYCEPDQNGVSFRLLEAIAYGRKIITNNSELLQVLGPNAGVVYFYSLDNLESVLQSIPDDFFSTKPEYPTLEYLRLENWIHQLLP